MKIRTRKIFRSFLLLILAAFSHALFVAQAADAVVTAPNEKVVSGQQAQVLHQVTDAKRSPSPRVPNGITLDSTLVREINNNHALLEHQTPRIKDELAKLKQAGYLDRRTKRDIEGSLREAHAIMSHLRRALQSGELRTWQARNMAQELNYQSDILDASLNEWQKNLGVTGEGALAADSEEKKAQQEQQQLIQTLSNISRMLHDTAKAIVRHAH